LRVDAVVLAGGLNCGPLQQYSTARTEALIPIGGRPMVEYVVNALKHVPAVRRIVIAGPCKDLAPVFKGDAAVQVAEGGDTAIATLLRGVEALEKLPLPAAEVSRWVLIATADIPMITPEAIEDFLRLCQKREGEVYYPVVKREVSEKKYPGVKRTYVRLREGSFTGGNLLLVDKNVIERCIPLAEKIVARRKNPLALCRLLGLKFVFKFLLHRLSLGEAEAKMSALLRVKGVAVVSQYAEVGVDVDKPSDLQLARRWLEAGCRS